MPLPIDIPPADMSPGVDAYDQGNSPYYGLNDWFTMNQSPYGQVGQVNPNNFQGGGSNTGSMAPYDPNYNYGSTGAGSGVPTQKWMSVIGSLLGGAAGSLIPGGSIIGAKLGGAGAGAFTKFLQNMLANRSGGAGGSDAHKMGMYDHNFDYGGGNGFGYVPGLTGDSYFNANGGPFQGGAFWSPPGGSIGGPLGVGSAGFEGTGHWDLLGNESMRRLLLGGDTSLGFAGMKNLNAGGNPGILPPSQWGGVGFGGNTGGGSNVSGGTITQRRMSQV